jgi:hypothetical protein
VPKGSDFQLLQYENFVRLELHSRRSTIVMSTAGLKPERFAEKYLLSCSYFSYKRDANSPLLGLIAKIRVTDVMPSSASVHLPLKPEIEALHGKRILISTYRHSVEISVVRIGDKLQASFLPHGGPTDKIEWKPLTGFERIQTGIIHWAERQLFTEEEIGRFEPYRGTIPRVDLVLTL